MRQHILLARARCSPSSRASSTTSVSLRRQHPGNPWVGGGVYAQPPLCPSAQAASAGHQAWKQRLLQPPLGTAWAPFPMLLHTGVPQAGALQRQPWLQLTRSGEVRAEEEGSRMSSPCSPPCTPGGAWQGSSPCFFSPREQKASSWAVHIPEGYQLIAPRKGDLQSVGKDAV